MSKHRKILLISRNFPPLTGGMERLLMQTFIELQKGFHCRLIGPLGAGAFCGDTVCFSECPSYSVFVFLSCALMKGVKHIFSYRPDIIIAGSGLTAPVAVLLAKLCRAKVAIIVHGLDIIVDNGIYQRTFIPAIRKADVIIANSRNTAQLVISKGISSEKVRLLHPGVTLSVANVKEEECFDAFSLGGRKVLLSVGRLVPRKGIEQFIKNSLAEIIKAVPETIYVIVGSAPDDALKKEESVITKIEEALIETGLQDHVLLLGKVDDKTLDALYAGADLFIFPVIDTPGDVEGFGMVAIEAAAKGLPTIAFESGGIPDAVKAGESGYLVPQGDYHILTECIINYLNGVGTEVTPQKCRKFAENFSWPKFGKRLRKICHELL